MKKVLLFILASVQLSLLNAQNNSLGNSDPAAKKVLDAVSAQFKKFKAVQAAFTLSLIHI